jgi:hypothetical protein
MALLASNPARNGCRTADHRFIAAGDKLGGAAMKKMRVMTEKPPQCRNTD